jgi:hypothetical protein
MVRTLPLLALLGLAACQVSVDNRSKRNAENAADSAGAAIGKAAGDAGKAIDKGAAKLENAADSLDARARRIDVHVNLGGHRGNGDAGDGNKAKH